MSATRYDVAKLAGVSPTTVSYVINNGPRPVSESTRKKVLWAIEQLEYRPNVIARSLKTKKTNTIGIVVSDILNFTHASIEKSIEDLLLQQNYSLTICNSDESPERERIWLELLRDRRMDGIILVPTGDNLSLLFQLQKSGLQFVLLDRLLEGFKADTVLYNNFNGAYEAVTYLIQKGHKQIGLLNLPSSLTPGKERRRGYEHALMDAGLPIRPDYIREGTFKAQEGSLPVTQILDKSPMPTALFISSNRLALEAIEEIYRRGLKIPDDIAIIVFDDVAYYSIMSPTISAVSSDYQQFGTMATKFLIERINGSYKGEPRIEYAPYQLVIRQSSG